MANQSVGIGHSSQMDCIDTWTHSWMGPRGRWIPPTSVDRSMTFEEFVNQCRHASRGHRSGLFIILHEGVETVGQSNRWN